MTMLPSRDQIKVGMKVFVELKLDQGKGKLTEGTVKEILTTGDTHPHGIMVELQGGECGRVKKLSNSAFLGSTEFEDLTKKVTPSCEDKFNEFKEFYQYDEGMDALPDTIPADKKSKLIEEKKQPVKKRFVIAISSFGNDSVGGFVYLGIRSDGTIVGLDRDKRVGTFADYDDKFANHIRDTLETLLKDRVFIITKLQIKFTERNGKTICIIQILPSSEPLFIHSNNTKEFYIRGPTPRAEHLDGKEMVSFIKQRFPNCP